MSRSGPRFDVDVSASSCRVNFLASSRIAHQHLHPVSAHKGPTECLGPSKIVVDLHKKNQWASSLTGLKSLFWSGPQTVARPLHMACTTENPFLQQRNPMDNRRPPRRTAAAPRPRRPPRRRQGIAARMSPPVRCPTIPTRVAKFLRRTTMLVGRGRILLQRAPCGDSVGTWSCRPSGGARSPAAPSRPAARAAPRVGGRAELSPGARRPPAASLRGRRFRSQVTACARRVLAYPSDRADEYCSGRLAWRILYSLTCVRDGHSWLHGLVVRRCQEYLCPCAVLIRCHIS